MNSGSSTFFTQNGNTFLGNLAADPGSGANGQYYYNTALNVIKMYSNGSFQVIFQGASTFPIPITSGGTGQTIAINAFNALSPLTTPGDTIYGTLAGGATRLPKGATGGVYVMGATFPFWAAFLGIGSGGIGTTTAIGGFNNLSPMTGVGDIIYGTLSGGATRLAKGTTGQVLTAGATFPYWDNAPSGSTPKSELWFKDSLGYGSSGTKIMKFFATIKSIGSGLTWNVDATNGDSVTVNQNCIVSVDFSQDPVTPSSMGISLNSNQLSTNISGIGSTSMMGFLSSSGVNFAASISRTFGCTAGDVIRAHTDGTAANSFVRFSVVQITSN